MAVDEALMAGGSPMASSPADDVEDIDTSNLTPAEKRKRRKQLAEAKEAARLERLQQKATAKRWKDEVAVVTAQKAEQKPAEEVAVVAEKKTSREERIAQLKAEREKKREEAKLAAQPPAKLAERCACGNVFLPEAVFCPKCGKKRPMAAADMDNTGASLPKVKDAAKNIRSASPLASDNGKKAKNDKKSKDAENKDEKENKTKKENKDKKEKTNKKEKKTRARSGSKSTERRKRRKKKRMKIQPRLLALPDGTTPRDQPTLPVALMGAAMVNKALAGEDSSDEDEQANGSCGSSSSSSTLSSLSSSSVSSGAMRIAKELAEGPAPSFSWERPVPIGPDVNFLPTRNACHIPLASLSGQKASSIEVETFLMASMVDPDAAARLRCLDPMKQRLVIEKGAIMGSRNPSSVLISRIRDAELGILEEGPIMGDKANLNMHMFMRCDDPKIEEVIEKYSLDQRASGLIRSLDPMERKKVYDLPLGEIRNPSAYIIMQLQGKGQKLSSDVHAHDWTQQLANFGGAGLRKLAPAPGTL